MGNYTYTLGLFCFDSSKHYIHDSFNRWYVTMTLSRYRRAFVLTLSLLAIAAFSYEAKAADPEPSSGVRVPKPNTPKRKFAAGIVTTIQPELRANETYTPPESIIEIVRGVANLSWDPNYQSKTRTLEAKASKVIFRRDLWGLEFSFKPLRMMMIDVPQPTGKMQRKQIWYMVYSIKNDGNPLRTVPAKDQYGDVTFAAKKVPGLPTPGIRFYPRFVLETQDLGKSYLDRVIPLANKVIAQRETGGSELYDTVFISRNEIPVSTADEDKSFWGVVIWEDIDPETDFFSIYIEGLTNAYKWEDDTESYQPGDEPGKHRKLLQKSLKLNFWRPGDKFQEHENEIRLGVPARPGIPGQVDYEWVYR